MKKLLALVLAGFMVLSFTACVKKENCILLYENPGDDMEASVTFDLDGNGEDEIKVSLTEDYYITVSSSDAEIKLGYGDAYYIDKIYGIDIDEKDGKKELVIITEELSSDLYMRVLRLDKGKFNLINFEYSALSENLQEYEYASLGYDTDIEVDGNVIKTSARGRCGMWSVESEYSYNDGVFSYIMMQERDVVLPSYEWRMGVAISDPDYAMELGLAKDENELNLLKEGYVIAYADFVNNGKTPEREGMIKLLSGDIFKITKEDADGFVFIEKKDGESGWIYMGDFSDNRYEVSEMAFFLAD